MRTRRISPVDLTRACLDRIERLDPLLGAFITVTAEAALGEARAAEAMIARGGWLGPLHGIPIGLKDLFDTAGVRTTAGSAFFVDRIPGRDAEVVQRLRAAGAVTLGKQNMHEFAFGTTSALSHFGPVRNPWNRECIAGGSSGGSAAAVAAGLGFGALGSDTGGSIRIPAAHCGVVGLKPTRGRVSNRGVVPLSWSLDHVGPLTRTVADAAVLLQAIAGYDPEDLSSREAPVPDYLGAIGGDASSLRVGVPRDYFFDGLDPDVEGAVTAGLAVLAGLTAGLREVAVPVSPEVNAIVMPAEAYAFHADRMEEHPEMFQAAVLGRLRQGQAVGLREYIRRRLELDRMRREAPGLFGDVDVFVTPAVPAPPVPIAGVRNDEDAVAQLARCVRPFNAYGLPAVSVPCGFGRTGLPVGLQIVGPPWGEERILRLAHAFEQATEWHRRRPPL